MFVRQEVFAIRASWLILAVVVLRQNAVESTCAPVRAVGDVPGWLLCQAEVHSGLLVAVGTIGLLVIGILNLRRDESGTDDRTEDADAQISNLAYPVRRTLAKSLDEGWELDEQVMDRRNRALELQRGFAEHERRVEEMLDEANRATPEVAEATRYAARLFWSAADGVNDMAAFEPQHLGDDPSDDLLRGYREAKSTTEDCVEILRRLDAPVREAEAG